MIAFALLSDPACALFALWALLLCLTNIGSAVLAAVRKRLRFVILALMLLLPVYMMWQVIFDLSLFGGTEKAAELSTVLGGQPWVYWLAAFAVLTLASVLLLIYNIHYDRTFITPGAIKSYLDKIPCGICCWRESGRVLFSNICMNRLCMALTDSPLLNGNHFRDAIPDTILTVEGKVWRFTDREITVDGERLYEMVASDITTEYVRTEALEKDKAELSRLNRELSEYYLSIDDTVRRQEILQAKMNIHDEMNRLMLSTMAADIADTRALDDIFSLWEQNALLLCMEADKKMIPRRKNAVDSLADALGIRLTWREEVPSAFSDEQKELFFCAAQEAITNAAKHAQAQEMEISFERCEDALTCLFTNDGGVPSGEVRFTGGLLNLSRLASQQGATLSVSTDKTFTLMLVFGKQCP